MSGRFGATLSVDGTTLENNAGVLRIKDLGVSRAKLGAAVGRFIHYVRLDNQTFSSGQTVFFALDGSSQTPTTTETTHNHGVPVAGTYRAVTCFVVSEGNLQGAESIAVKLRINGVDTDLFNITDATQGTLLSANITASFAANNLISLKFVNGTLAAARTLTLHFALAGDT
jgi:hypothetical protein